MPPAAATRSPLAILRFTRGLSQADLAAQAHVSRETISRLERGENPTLVTAQAVAAALGVALTELFPDNGESAPTADGTLSATFGGGAADRALAEH